MILRKLKVKDAPLMFSWMHDPRVNSYLQKTISTKTMEDVNHFIISSKKKGANLHLAIVSDKDEYMGTVSLKNIQNKTAEFAIAVRYEAMGKGYSWYGMEKILEKAFNELKLDSVYWCVNRNNQRAVRFYDKHGFHESVDIPAIVLNRYKDVKDLKWYSVLKGDCLNLRESVAGCKVIKIATIPTLDAGELSFFESKHDIPFEIKRIYYISKVPEGVRRGFHAHKELKQLIFCPYGKIQLTLESKQGREEIELSDPSVGIIIDKMIWREMVWLQKNSVLCVAASDYYKESDYIRDYSLFKKMIGS